MLGTEWQGSHKQAKCTKGNLFSRGQKYVS